MSNYLLKPPVKNEFLHPEKPSLLSISASLSLLFCCTAAKIFFREIACSEWIHATTFYWCCQKEGIWVAAAFLKEYTAKQSCWGNMTTLIFHLAHVIKNISACFWKEWDITSLQKFLVHIQYFLFFCWLKWDKRRNGSALRISTNQVIQTRYLFFFNECGISYSRYILGLMLAHWFTHKSQIIMPISPFFSLLLFLGI